MANKELVIRPLQLVEMEGPEAVMLYLVGFDIKAKAAGYMFYIEGADKNIIVDTSGSAESLTMAGFSATQIATPEDALKKVGLKCEDIDMVIFTHLHFDHVEYASKFTKAKFICQSAELREALYPHPGIDSLLYWPHLYKDLKFVTVTGDQEISDGIRAMLTPGHTPGGQTVLIETKKGVAAITGMCCVTENFYPPEPYNAMMEMITPGIHENVQTTYESMNMIKHTADIIVPIHDIKWSTVDRIP
jgi:glyoxylase-like metal-dependent hydrolase (beta-lactamase superfamily II)